METSHCTNYQRLASFLLCVSCSIYHLNLLHYAFSAIVLSANSSFCGHLFFYHTKKHNSNDALWEKPSSNFNNIQYPIVFNTFKNKDSDAAIARNFKTTANIITPIQIRIWFKHLNDIFRCCSITVNYRSGGQFSRAGYQFLWHDASRVIYKGYEPRWSHQRFFLLTHRLNPCGTNFCYAMNVLLEDSTAGRHYRCWSFVLEPFVGSDRSCARYSLRMRLAALTSIRPWLFQGTWQCNNSASTTLSVVFLSWLLVCWIRISSRSLAVPGDIKYILCICT